MKLRRCAAACAAVVLAAGPAFAAFDDAPFGARDAAMGGAFTAVHDEVGALAYNPASLGQAPALEAAATYLNGTHPPAGTLDRDTTRAAVAVPVRQEIFNGAFGFDVRYDRRVNVAKDREIGFYYGTRGLRETEGGGLDFGAGLKILRSSLEAGGATKTKPALDLGALWRFGDKHSVGASLLNLGGAKFSRGSYSDRAPLAFKIGAAESVHGSLLAVDGTIREPSAGLAGSESFAVGFERWWPSARSGSFAGRTGFSVGNLSRTWNWGLGWKLGGGRVDYAMGIPMTGVTRFTHALTVAVRFGRSDPDAEYERLLEGEISARRRLGQSLEASAVRQQALSDEIGRLHDEIAGMRSALAEKKLSEDAARRKLADLEARHKKAVESFQRLQDEHARNAAKTKAELFREEWAAYQKSKMGGEPDATLASKLQRLMLEYRDSGVDLSEANLEFRRLQQAP
ncbi:MAG: hypothetical protein KGL74_09530 [Elusimicrobia bacterium]|nr:hypothetical protein [Elusimicrobiota bacterium]